MSRQIGSSPARAMRWWSGVLVLLSACTVVFPPVPPRPGSPSARLLATGAYRVGRHDVVLVDPSRANDTRIAAGEPLPRRLVTTIWFPRDAAGPHPLVLYSHGFLGTRHGGSYLAEYLASRGYVVAAPDHPLTRRWAAGGVTVADVVNQPGDLRFVIDRLLAGDARPRSFHGAIDPERIGVMGLSLGGLTATLMAYHPRLRDPRIRAAVSIAGPLAIFGPTFFADVSVPFLMIAGDADVIIDYATNAPLAVQRVPGGALVGIGRGSHVGFDDTATGLLRLLGNPDRVGCWMLSRMLDLERADALLQTVAGTEANDLEPGGLARPCARAPRCVAMDPARQQLITRLAVGAFFDSALSTDPAVREAGARYLGKDLARDFREAMFAGAVGEQLDTGTKGRR